MKLRCWGSVAVCVLLLVAASLYWWRLQWLEQSQDIPILAAARHYEVQPALVKAVVWRESRFHPGVHGRAGELGLMQLRDAAAAEWAQAEHISGFQHEHCLDPATNTMAGAFYLHKLLQRYRATDDPMVYALSDYNAGRANVLKWNHGAAATNSADFVKQIGFPGTRAYVQAVLQRYALYGPRFPGGAPVSN